VWGPVALGWGVHGCNLSYPGWNQLIVESLLDPSENFVRHFSIGVPREAGEIWLPLIEPFMRGEG
jgi:hypothetical protein